MILSLYLKALKILIQGKRCQGDKVLLVRSFYASFLYFSTNRRTSTPLPPLTWTDTPTSGNGQFLFTQVSGSENAT